jgi:ribosomal protein S18 acetylase RimI-like enzyme
LAGIAEEDRTSHTFTVSVRKATDLDREALYELYEEFFAEVETPAYWGVTLAAELAEVDEILADGLAFLAEEDSKLVGFVLARRKEGTRGLLSDIYVRPQSRRKRHGTKLARAVAEALQERGATDITLSVHVANAPARAAYERWGFRNRTLTLEAQTEELRQRLS